MSGCKAAVDARRGSAEEDLTIDSSDDEYDPAPGSDDEYQLDGFVVGDEEDSEGGDTPKGDVDASNILPAGSRRARRATQTIYDDPRFAAEFAATLLTDVPMEELDVAIGEDSDEEERRPVASGCKRKRGSATEQCKDTDGDFAPSEDDSDSDVEIESEDESELGSM